MTHDIVLKKINSVLFNFPTYQKIVDMKKSFGYAYGFKFNCTSNNERLSKLEDCFQSRPNNERNIFPPFGNEFLPPSRNITLKGRPIIYPSRHKDLYNYNLRCLMSSGLMFNDTIMNILKNKKLECYDEEDDFFYKILRTKEFIYTGDHFMTFTGRKEYTSV